VPQAREAAPSTSVEQIELAWHFHLRDEMPLQQEKRDKDK
jgi:hypothetical protein